MSNDKKVDKKDLKKPRPPQKGPPVLTPEFLAEQRAKREQRKAEKRKLRQDQGIEDPQQQNGPENLKENLEFIKRPILQIPGNEAGNSANLLNIMTYNVLAQTLIRRELFPENGDILKWKLRSKVLTKEILHYAPRIICMQEVDKDRAVSPEGGNNKVPFWREFFTSAGLAYEFYTLPSKTHGQLIAYDPSLFELVDTVTVSYDDIETPGAPKQIVSKNTALFLVLRNKQQQKSGIIIGTTHLFWHPKGSYERTRQMGIFLQKSNELSEQYRDFNVVLAGDFNSECFDGPYMMATGKDVSESTDTYRILIESAMHKFTKSIDESAVDINEDGGEADSNSTDVSNTTSGNLEDIHLQEAKSKIQALVGFYKQIPSKFVSVYGENYKYVHPSNIHPRSTGEPKFSNWAHAWRGLLDYIFILDKQKSCMSTVGLLRLPEPNEMGPEPSGQPKIGQYPSDHLCLMASIEQLS